MSENERLARNDEEPGRTFEAERAQARDEEPQDVEGHRLYNPADARVADAEDEAKRLL